MLENAWPQLQSIYLLGFVFITTSRQHSQELKQLKECWRLLLHEIRDSPVLKNILLLPAQPHKPAATSLGAQSTISSACGSPCSTPWAPALCPAIRAQHGDASSTAEQGPGQQGDDTQLTGIISRAALQGKGCRPPTEITQQLPPASHDSKLQRIWDKSLKLTPLKPRGENPQKSSLLYYNDTLFDSQQFWYPNLLSVSQREVIQTNLSQTKSSKWEPLKKELF